MTKKYIYENLNIINKKYNSLFIRSFTKFLKKDKFILGNNLKEFENNFSKYIGSNYALGVGNGLDALTMTFKCLNSIKKNKNEVILAANSYYACILSVINAGLKPILVEPNLDNYNINTNLISKKINSKTLAVLAVHMYGKSCDMKKLVAIRNSKKIFLVEDCSQSHGAKYNNKLTGSFGDVSCFSFYPTKNLGGLGDSGAICCKSFKIFNILKHYRNYGSLKRYKNKYIGYNSRMDDIQAMMLNIKLKNLDQENKKKNILAKIYLENLSNRFIKPKLEKNKYDVYYTFNIRTKHRKKLIKYLENNNIGFDIHYPLPPYRQEALKNMNFDRFKVSDIIHNTILSLPISTMYEKEDIRRITKIINQFKLS